MGDWLPLLIKALVGGIFVVAFALVGDVLQPKRFAGLFAAAPSIALSSLLIAALTKGIPYVTANARGMVLGAVALVAYCVSSVYVVDRLHALAGSVASWATWFAVAAVLALVFLR